MKTAERILDISRTLFNEQGERNVTASDIALALDISPGNLYYHFKGKDEIIAALWQHHQRHLAGALGTPIHSPDLLESDQAPVIEQVWLYLTVVLNRMYAHRFVYYNLDDLMHRYRTIQRGMPRLVTMAKGTCTALAVQLLEESGADRGAHRIDRIAGAMNLTLTYWLSFDNMQRPAADATDTVHRGVLQILSVCAPFLGSAEAQFYEECEALHQEMLMSDSAGASTPERGDPPK